MTPPYICLEYKKTSSTPPSDAGKKRKTLSEDTTTLILYEYWDEESFQDNGVTYLYPQSVVKKDGLNIDGSGGLGFITSHTSSHSNESD